MNKGIFCLLVLARIGEIDDGVFDWMLQLDHKRRQKELLREADRAAKESQPREFNGTNLTITPQEVLSPSVPHPHQGPLTPVSTNALASTPANPTFEVNETQNTHQTQAIPTAAPVIEQLQKEPPPKKKKKWWKRLFMICRSTKE
jgi:hypothetical protein